MPVRVFGFREFRFHISSITVPAFMLTDFALRDFRCFTEAKLELHPSTTLLVGRNAQGKTSLLEAACVLMRLQSPRTSLRQEMVRFDTKAAVIEGRWQAHALRCAFSQTTRRLALDGTLCTRTADYLAHSALVVWMDHSDMNLLRGSSEHRRRYLDFAASQIFPEYLHALRGYEKALRSRNYQLKRDTMVNWRQADAYAHIMEAYAQTLCTRRAELVAALQPHALQVLAHLSEGRELVQISYTQGFHGESLFEALLMQREQEERTRTTAAGPHRDDIGLHLNERDATSFASEGQQRSLSLAMKLAQARVLHTSSGQPPLLLLDDVFGELDPMRRRALLEGLPLGSQKIITTTHLDWASECGSEQIVVQVDAGKLQLGTGVK
jgi:DNA replication and repair protein RecF